VIEDAPAAFARAKRQERASWRLRTTASDAELQQAGADWIVDDCAELFLDSSAAGEKFFADRPSDKIVPGSRIVTFKKLQPNPSPARRWQFAYNTRVTKKGILASVHATRPSFLGPRKDTNRFMGIPTETAPPQTTPAQVPAPTSAPPPQRTIHTAQLVAAMLKSKYARQ